ncbi:hypothetical protein MalM14_31200 [Gimesia chilikensis]|nr:hypothetical protein MalM14_31200 [Gimesia chilikensis]
MADYAKEVCEFIAFNQSSESADDGIGTIVGEQQKLIAFGGIKTIDQVQTGTSQIQSAVDDQLIETGSGSGAVEFEIQNIIGIQCQVAVDGDLARTVSWGQGHTHVGARCGCVNVFGVGPALNEESAGIVEQVECVLDAGTGCRFAAEVMYAEAGCIGLETWGHTIGISTTGQNGGEIDGTVCVSAPVHDSHNASGNHRGICRAQPVPQRVEIRLRILGEEDQPIIVHNTVVTHDDIRWEVGRIFADTNRIVGVGARDRSEVVVNQVIRDLNIVDGFADINHAVITGAAADVVATDDHIRAADGDAILQGINHSVIDNVGGLRVISAGEVVDLDSVVIIQVPQIQVVSFDGDGLGIIHENRGVCAADITHFVEADAAVAGGIKVGTVAFDIKDVVVLDSGVTGIGQLYAFVAG